MSPFRVGPNVRHWRIEDACDPALRPKRPLRIVFSHGTEMTGPRCHGTDFEGVRPKRSLTVRLVEAIFDGHYRPDGPDSMQQPNPAIEP